MLPDIAAAAQGCNPIALFLSFVVFFLLLIYYSQRHIFTDETVSTSTDGKESIHFKNLPSPFSYPIVGHILDLGSLPHLVLTQWSEKYGPLFKIKMGNQEVLVVSGNKIIKQALKSRDFAGRSDMETTKLISEGLSLTFSDFSPIWQHQKTTAKAAVRLYTTGTDPTKRSVMETSSFKHANSLIDQLLQVTDAENGLVNPRDPILTSASSVICKVCFGKDFDLDNQLLHNLLSINRNFDGAMANSQPVNFWPILKYFPVISKSYKNLQIYASEYWKFIKSLLSSHWETYNDKVMRDLVDCLYYQSETERCNNNELHQRNKNEEDSASEEFHTDSYKLPGKASEEELKKRIIYNVGDIFGAGYDTMFTMLHWSFLYLAVFPDTQTKIREEVNNVVPSSDAPSFRIHGNKCPYTIAWLYELMRHCTPSPLLIPHKTTRGVEFGGCFIPKDVPVYFNIWQAHRDPTIWEDPESFKPERFLTTKEDGLSSLKKNSTTHLLSWGAGERKCLGHELSKHQLFIFITTIVRQLLIEPSKPGIEPALPWPVTFGLTIKPKEFKLKLTKL